MDKIKNIEKVNIIVDKKNLNKSIKIVNEATIYAEAVNKTRDLVNTPPNIANPDYLADYAEKTAKNNNLK